MIRMQKNMKKVEKQKNEMKLKLFKNCKFLCKKIFIYTNISKTLNQLFCLF